MRKVIRSLIPHVFIQQCSNEISDKHKGENKQDSTAEARLQRSRACHRELTIKGEAGSLPAEGGI